MMLRGEHDIFRASVVEYFSPGVRIPLLNLPVEDWSEVVVIVVRAIMLAMVGLRRCSLEPHAVQIPFCIGVLRRHTIEEADACRAIRDLVRSAKGTAPVDRGKRENTTAE